MKDDLNIDESKGEMLCDECEGRGCIPPEIDSPEIMQEMCWKCQGSGKVDWVSNVMQKPKPQYFGFGSSSFYNSTATYSTSGNASPLHDDIIDSMAKALAMKIDNEIIDNIMKGQQQMYEPKFNWEVKEVDNRIVSKFMFYPHLKQKFPGETNEGPIS